MLKIKPGDVAVAPVSDEKAAEYETRARADFNPNETLRERAERLSREAKEAETALAAEERSAAAAKLLSTIQELAKLVESENPGKVCRNLTVRYQKPGDVEPEIVAKLEPNKPGIFVSFRVVKPKARQAAE
jgi:hypothetical protein